MNKPMLVALGIAVIVVVAIIGGVFYMQRGAHVELQGKILKVRTAPLDENSSVAVLDFRFTNVADYPFTVHNVAVTLEDKSGKLIQGTPIAETDAQRLFQALPLLGQKYSASLIVRDEIPAHGSQDRMVAARFEIPESQMEAHRQLTIRIQDAAGPVSEIKEK
jgi:hypothetical protein